MLWTKTRTTPFDYFREKDALAEQYRESINKAGIAAQVERCERRLEPDWFEDRHLPPLFTKARSEAEKRQDAQKFQSYRKCQRDIIFGVADIELRKKLISIERKFGLLKIKSFQNDLDEAQRRLNDAGKLDYFQSFFVAAGGAVAVMLGWQYRGPMGGTAAAVFAIIIAMYALQELQWTRIRNIERATAEVTRLEETVNTFVVQEVFSQLEEDIGEKQEAMS